MLRSASPCSSCSLPLPPESPADWSSHPPAVSAGWRGRASDESPLGANPGVKRRNNLGKKKKLKPFESTDSLWLRHYYERIYRNNQWMASDSEENVIITGGEILSYKVIWWFLYGFMDIYPQWTWKHIPVYWISISNWDKRSDMTYKANQVLRVNIH